VVGFYVALAQEVALVTCVVYWRVHNAKADPYGAISVRV
jgi:hypothetical protein